MNSNIDIRRLDISAVSQLFDFVPDTLFYMKDATGNWLTCNQQTLSLLGARSMDQLRGRSELDLFPRNVAAAVRRDDRRVLDHGEIIVDRIETLIDPLGVLVWARTTKVPVRTAEGSIGALIGITRLLGEDTTTFPCPELKPVIAFVGSHYAEPIRVAQLASVASVSPAGLRSRFQRHFNLSPHQFVMRTRMQAAATLLRGSRTPIAEIAVGCGFYDQNQFTRLFSTYFGLSPRRFRAR